MKLFIASCNLAKQGTKDGRSWSLYKISDPKGVQYSTFDAKYVGMVGQEVDVVVEEKAVEKNGKSYVNRTIIEPKRGNGNGAGTEFIFTGYITELKKLNSKIDELHKMVSDLVVEPSEPDRLSENGGPSDLPF